MELQIQDLVSSIKKDGIESANREAAQILAEAKAQAEKIVADARSEADKLRADAQAEIGVFKASAQLSAEQAKRDAVLAFRQEIGAELTKLLAQDTHKALDDKALAALITALAFRLSPSALLVFAPAAPSTAQWHAAAAALAAVAVLLAIWGGK